MSDLSRRVDRLEATALPSRVVVVVLEPHEAAPEPAQGETLFVVDTGVPRSSSWGQWNEGARCV